MAQCIDRGLTLETLPLEDYRAVCDLFDQEVYHKINLDTCVATRISEGGPCPESVEQQIGKVQAFSRQLSIIKYWHCRLDYAGV